MYTAYIIPPVYLRKAKAILLCIPYKSAFVFKGTGPTKCAFSCAVCQRKIMLIRNEKGIVCCSNAQKHISKSCWLHCSMKTVSSKKASRSTSTVDSYFSRSNVQSPLQSKLFYFISFCRKTLSVAIIRYYIAIIHFEKCPFGYM